MQALNECITTQYILYKHHLLRDPHVENVLQAVNDIIALHATNAATPYLSLFARVKNFQKKHLDKEFYVKRNLVRFQAMRGTLFITSTELTPVLYQATKMPESELLNWIQEWGIPTSEYGELTEKLHNILKGGGKTLPEIKKVLPRDIIRSVEQKVGKTIYKMTNINIVLNAMTHQGIVISEKSVETLRTTKANRYVLFQEVYPNLNLEVVEGEKAKTTLGRLYIKAFGPVTEEDIAWWTGFNKMDIEKTLEAIDMELLQVKISDLESEYLMLKKD